MERIVRNILMLAALVVFGSGLMSYISPQQAEAATNKTSPRASHSSLVSHTSSQEVTEEAKPHEAGRPLHKVLVIGDSMTGWMAERIDAYGKENGFETATVIWDGSTIKKWAANENRLRQIIAKEKPDHIIVSLGMNEMFITNPSSLEAQIDKILSEFGDISYTWVGPPTWPGKGHGKVMTDWMQEKLGDNFYNSFHLTLPRQSKTNPHPTRAGMCTWTDTVMQHVEKSRHISLTAPASGKMSRPASYTYRKMKQNL